MGTKLTERIPSLADARWLLGEVQEHYKQLDQLRERLLALPPNDPSRLDLLPEIAVAAEILRAKLSSLITAINGAKDEMPDDDA